MLAENGRHSPSALAASCFAPVYAAGSYRSARLRAQRFACRCLRRASMPRPASPASLRFGFCLADAHVLPGRAPFDELLRRAAAAQHVYFGFSGDGRHAATEASLVSREVGFARHASPAFSRPGGMVDAAPLSAPPPMIRLRRIGQFRHYAPCRFAWAFTRLRQEGAEAPRRADRCHEVFVSR